MHGSPSCCNGWHSQSWIGLKPAIATLTVVYSLFVAASGVQAGERRLSLNVSYELNGPLVSVSAQTAPLTWVLRELAARTGLDIQVDPTVAFNVVQYFERLPLDMAIQRLAGPHATLLVYGSGSGSGASQLRKVHVMARRAPRPDRLAERRPDAAALDDYGRAWLSAHHGTDLRSVPGISIKAALSWQKYLAQLPSAQRMQLHKRMLQTRTRRIAAGQMAATTTSYYTATP